MSENPIDDPNVQALAAKALGKEVPEVKEPEKEVIGEKIEDKIEEEKIEKEEEKKDEDKKEEKVEEEEKKEEEATKKEEEEKEESKVDANLARKFTALSRKEKSIRMREKELESKVEQYKDLEDLVALAKENPTAAMEKLGFNYEQLTSFLLKGDKPEINRISKLEKELEQIKLEKQEFTKKDEQRRIDDSVSGFKDEIEEHITEDKIKYELLNENSDAKAIIYQMISQDYDNKKEVADREGYEITLEDAMTIEEASNLAEQYLYDEISKYTKAKKFAPKVPEPKKEPEKVPESKQKKVEEKKIAEPSAPNTLANKLAAQLVPSNDKPVSRQDEIDAVTEEFSGKLFNSE